jgi:hypothetical protein
MQPEKVRPTGKISPGNHAARQSRAHDVASIKPLAAFDVHHHEIAASSVNPSVHAEQQHIDSEMVLRWAKRDHDAYEKRVQAYKRDQHVHARDTWNLDPQIIANLNNADDRWNLDPETYDTCANSSTAPVAPLARADSPPPSSPRGSPEFKYIKPQHHDVQARDTWNLDPQIIANLNNADRWNLDPETYDTANSSTAPVAPLAHVDSQPPSSPRGSPEFKYIKRVAGQWVQDKRETLDSTADPAGSTDLGTSAVDFGECWENPECGPTWLCDCCQEPQSRGAHKCDFCSDMACLPCNGKLPAGPGKYENACICCRTDYVVHQPTTTTSTCTTTSLMSPSSPSVSNYTPSEAMITTFLELQEQGVDWKATLVQIAEGWIAAPQRVWTEKAEAVHVDEEDL